MRRFTILLISTFLLVAVCGCHHYYTMPEGGTKIRSDMVEADSKGNFYVILDKNCEAVLYHGFVVMLEKDSPLKAYATFNTYQNADWRVDPADFKDCQLTCQVTRTLIPPAGLPPQFTADSLKPFCRGRYGLFKDGTMLNISNTTFCGKPAIEYIARIAPVNQPATLIHGIMVYAEDEPGVFLDILYFQKEGESESLK